MRTTPNNHIPFFRAAIKTKPHSQTFISAVKRQKIFARSPLFLLSTSKEENSTQRLIGLQQTITEIQLTRTDLLPPYSKFLSTSGNHHKLYSFLNPNKQHPLFNEQSLNERRQKQSESTEHKLQKESVYQLQTDLSSVFSSSPTSVLSRVKQKQQITTKRKIDVCHHPSPSNLRSARIAL